MLRAGQEQLLPAQQCENIPSQVKVLHSKSCFKVQMNHQQNVLQKMSPVTYVLL